VDAIHKDPLYYDVAVQLHAVVVLFFHVGARPSSVFVTPDQKYFLPWKNISIYTRYTDDPASGHAVLNRIDVKVVLDNFKVSASKR
jgi:hypothetical protein